MDEEYFLNSLQRQIISLRHAERMEKLKEYYLLFFKKHLRSKNFDDFRKQSVSTVLKNYQKALEKIVSVRSLDDYDRLLRSSGIDEIVQRFVIYAILKQEKYEQPVGFADIIYVAVGELILRESERVLGGFNRTRDAICADFFKMVTPFSFADGDSVATYCSNERFSILETLKAESMKNRSTT
ncbi:hypothetical protein [Acetobacter orleanensis]|uniref:Uncharacterized protein n=1 Tax=Acetobacter orleanensis TaxID=104099 RepID=A0A4Y3TQB9_9PROT|nr:hypothetical protein [Acetobacter orleanensis]KXV66732.1 hypothetical protein AD949_01555 [Acetobacter orleanensis]PCD78786.1 hypothetical protein CO710_10675 [Acetobacter orleanensis]GAN69757.1 hypothetical protein Abol_070_002 [Acetobacter orleanensis JCM 7639]GBR23393.1 hypothetical protein AA0473_0367 [Acetobacter orleanensis NRIC 0473]GEB83923.1 hypothetical protein AOR01nite_24000 [Acetobacter orleanensis]